MVKEDRERQLAKMSFTSDVQIVRELDEIAGTTGSEMYSKSQIFEFLRSKLWVIEELADVPDKVPDNDEASE